MTKRGDGLTAKHPKLDLKKALSYLTRLCQPSSRLFQYVDKIDRRAACGRAQQPGAACPTGTANRPPHKADLY